MKRLLRNLCALCVFVVNLPAAPQSGAPLLVGPNNGIGPLSVGLSSYPVGAAKITGGKQADLLVSAGKFSMQPGLFLLPWVGVTQNGTPIVGAPVALNLPGVKPPLGPATLLEHKNDIYLLHAPDEKTVECFRLDRPRGRFGEFVRHSRITMPKLPRGPTAIAATMNDDGSLDIILAMTDGAKYRPAKPDWRSPDYVPYDGTGRWTGGYPWISHHAVTNARGLNDGTAENFRRVSAGTQEVLLRGGAIARIPSTAAMPRSYVASTWLGDLYYYKNATPGGPLAFERKHWLRDPRGSVLRHPACGGVIAIYPNAAGAMAGLVVGGESAVYFYRFTGMSGDAFPTFEQPAPVLQHGAALFGGSLPVPDIIDIDGDGLPDIIAGNSEGRLLLFHNQGTPDEPSFTPGVALFAGGEEILVQPGARGSLQGPSEAHWGYLSPTAVDWNGDGLPDIVASSATGEHIVWMNIGTRAQPRFRAAQTLLCNGLEIHGTWRVRPGAAKLGDRMAYVAPDDDDQLHIYWRLDDRNLGDGGKLKMQDGSPISTNYLGAGGTGRIKILLADWDGDGRVDLILGTTTHHTVPNPVTGIPWNDTDKSRKGAMVLFLKNVGTNEEPVFAWPEYITHKGVPLKFGHHECAPAVGAIAGEPCLIVGRETGQIYYYKKSDLGLLRAPTP